MTSARDLPLPVREALTLVAKTSDRTPPAVFTGRDEEFKLLGDAVWGIQNGSVGQTVVVQGVPGAGKTALLHEYAIRLLAANADVQRPVIPVPLQPHLLAAPPNAIVQEIDRQFRRMEASDEWKRQVNRAVGSASLVGRALFAAFTKRDFGDFRASARPLDALPAALEDYAAFRFHRRDSTIVLLVDEAQSLDDTAQVRANLGALHNNAQGDRRAMLACFGLMNTTDRLRELGLSRLAKGHARSIGALSPEDARRAVLGALEIALADYPFDGSSTNEAVRSRWLGAAGNAILAESADFPHHLANGCRALAEIVLDQGVSDVPPLDDLVHLCRKYKREYYDARLRPWAKHTVALAHAFGGRDDGWKTIDSIVLVLMASDDFGRPVGADSAIAIVEDLCANGYVERNMDVCRPALPSLTSYLMEKKVAVQDDSAVARKIRDAMPSARKKPR